MNALFQLNQMMAGDKVAIYRRMKTEELPGVKYERMEAYVTWTEEPKHDEEGRPYIYFGYEPYDLKWGVFGAARYYPVPYNRPPYGIRKISVLKQQAQPPRSI